jgi:hypothetical protein
MDPEVAGMSATLERVDRTCIRIFPREPEITCAKLAVGTHNFHEPERAVVPAPGQPSPGPGRKLSPETGPRNADIAHSCAYRPSPSNICVSYSDITGKTPGVASVYRGGFWLRGKFCASEYPKVSTKPKSSPQTCS